MRSSDTPARKNNGQVLVVNTHLLFPHNPYSSRIRLREVQKVCASSRERGFVYVCACVCVCVCISIHPSRWEDTG